MPINEVDPAALRGLGMTPADVEGLERVLRRGRGAIFVSGPAGSGRRSVMYSLLCALNDESQSLMTGEQTVGTPLEGVTQTQVSADDRLADWMQRALLFDADVLMVEPPRSIADAVSIVRAASQRVVIVASTADNSLGPLREMMELGASAEIVCHAVTCVIACRLVPRLCPNCRRDAEVPAEVLAPFEPLHRYVPEVRASESSGCEQCGHTGRRGWVGLYEVREIGPHLKAILGGDFTPKQLDEAARSATVMSLLSHALQKADAGLIDLRDLQPLVDGCSADESVRFWEN